MTQYVELSTDTAKVIRWFAGPQDPAVYPGYAEIADTDTRLAVYRSAQQAQSTSVALLKAGMQLVSTGTSSLNGTYAVDDSAAIVIDGIYSGIKDGDGLPGGGTTFNYPD